jgi:tRNA dimethylallyltransferase
LESNSNSLVIILGPTGVGKSRTSLFVAHAFAGEVINCDSTQVYRGFDIGTDKLPEEQREGVPHHLMDMVEPEVQFTAAEFVRTAVKAAQEIWKIGRLPIVTGGTGLYLKALINGLFPEGQKDPEIRFRLEQKASAEGLESLWHTLREVDPEYARKIGPRDRHRIIRALEVFEATGIPISAHFAQTRSKIADANLIRIGLYLERDELHRRINQRVDRMFAEGLVDEVRYLLDSGVRETVPPFRALGYKQVLRYLQQEITLAEARELVKRETRQYAKRQMTWFRKMEGIRWFSPLEHEAIKEYISSGLRE